MSFELSKLKKKQNFEYTQQIVDGNKIEPPYTEDHIYMQIIISWAYIYLWLSFLFGKKFKSKLDRVFGLVFKFYVKWYNIPNYMTIIFNQ